jgi:hypothetical protein
MPLLDVYAVDSIVAVARQKFPLVDLSIVRDNSFQEITVIAQVTAPNSQGIWRESRPIRNEALARATDLVEVVVGAVYDAIENVINAIPIEIIGLYPFARIWHDSHVSGPKLVWYPKLKVEGWVFSKAYMEYPKDRGASEATTLSDYESNEIEPINESDLKGVLKMAEKKKRTVRRAPLPKSFDPSNVRPPQCPIHNDNMYFDAVGQKWRCNTQGCRQVARPARDEDDKTVILGKGSLQLRLVAQNGDRSVVLISDDNVCLDVTKLVDVDEVISKFDAEDQARAAAENGKENFSIPNEQTIGLSARLVVIGATDLTE